MARKRVNKGLLIGLAATAALAGGGVLYGYKHRHVQNPEQLRAAAVLAVKEGRHEEAIQNAAALAGILPQDVQAHNILGQEYANSNTVGTDNLNSSVAEFTKAAELEPKSVEAWQGLLQDGNQWVSIFESRPDDRARRNLPQLINTARDAANHLSKLQPDNFQAREAGPELIIRAWILKLPLPENEAERTSSERPSADKRAEQAIIDLTNLAKEHPEKETVPYWIARGKINQAVLALHAGRPQDASPLFAEAANQFDASIALSPKTVSLYLYKAKIIQQLQQIDPTGVNSADYRTKLHDALDTAQQLVDIKNAQQYLDAKQEWARQLSGSNPADSEAVLRDLVDKFPDDIQNRLMLASLLQHDASRRDDALATLDAIPSNPGPSVANNFQRMQWQTNFARSKLLRADIQTDAISTMPAGKLRDDKIADVKASLDLAAPVFNGKVDMLRVLGRFQLATGQITDSIKTFTQAYDKMTAEGGVDYKLLRYTANAYRAGGQVGKAIELLEQAMKNESVANTAEVNFTMADLNIENREYKKAKQYIDWLVVRYPKDVHTITLQLRDLGPDPDLKIAQPLFDQLPESNNDEIRSKLQVATLINDKPDQIRLLQQLHTQKPDDRAVAVSLIGLLRSVGDVNGSNKLCDELIKNNPDDKGVALYVKGIKGEETQTEMLPEQAALIDAMKDPLARHLKKAEFFAAQQQVESQVAELQEAAKVAESNNDSQALIGILNQIFVIDLAQRNYIQAEALLPKLVDLNGDQAHGLMLKCRLALGKQDVQAALVYARSVSQEFPNYTASWELYGEALEASGQLDAACRQFNTALSLTNTNVEARRHLIDCLVGLGKIDDARANLDKAREEYPDDPVYREMTANFEIHYGNPESVLPIMADAIKAHPQDRRNYLIDSALLTASKQNRTVKGDPNTAKEFLTQGITLLRSAVEKWPDDIRFTNILAQMLQENNDFKGAEDSLKTLSESKRWKGQPAPLILLGKVYLNARKLDLADAILKQALAADDKSVDARMMLADCRLMQEKPDDAITILQPVLASYPAHEKYVDLLLSMNKGAMAEVDLNDAIKADPTNAALINLRMQVYDAEGRWDTGLRAANEALIADQGNVFAYFWRGKFEASGQNPDMDQAVKDLSFFRDSVPTDIKGRLVLATVLQMKGDLDGAIHELEIAINFDPQNRDVRLMLVRDYLNATPQRSNEADRLLTISLTLPAFSHDPDFESNAALVWAQKGLGDKAVQMMQQAVKDAKNKDAYLHDYLNVLLTTKQYDLVLTETDVRENDSKTPWFVYSARGVAKAMGTNKDLRGSAAEFDTTLNRSGIERGDSAAGTIIAEMNECLGIDKSIAAVMPRTQNSISWKLLATSLLIGKNDIAGGIQLVEAAMPSLDSLKPYDQQRLLREAASLYILQVPPNSEKAISAFQKLLALNPEDTNAMNDMAYVLSDMSTPPRYQDALVWSQKAYDITQKAGRIEPRINDTQGWILIENNRVLEGVSILHQGVDRMDEHSDFPEAHYHLARGYLKLKHVEEAQRELGNATSVLERVKALHQPFDPSLQGKIDTAQKEAIQMLNDMSQGKSTP